jgi:hypothetical protein
MTKATTDLSRVVNASGFALQIAIEEAVECSSTEHNFEIEAHEHPWKTDEDAGFIDLIVGRSNIRIVCECKRSRDAVWVFLREREREPVDRARLLWLKREAGDVLSGWHDFQLTTSAHESSFCVVRGHGENDVPLLERIARKLVLSVEALASEETELLDEDDDTRIYIPVILTTAQLWVCRYSPSTIDLRTGLIGDEEKYENVEAVCFRKALTTTAVTQRTADEMAFRAFRRLSLEQERTVLIINAASFIKTLRAWQRGAIRESDRAPWEIGRTRKR